MRSGNHCSVELSGGAKACFFGVGWKRNFLSSFVRTVLLFLIVALGSSLDVTPTLLGLIGRSYQTLFFGRDLLKDPPEGARALLNHNRDIGLFARDRMVVLGLQKTVEYYQGDPKVGELKPVGQATPEFLELEKQATAIYQVADDLYMHRLYRIDGMPQGDQPAVPGSNTHSP